MAQSRLSEAAACISNLFSSLNARISGTFYRENEVLPRSRPQASELTYIYIYMIWYDITHPCSTVIWFIPLPVYVYSVLCVYLYVSIFACLTYHLFTDVRMYFGLGCAFTRMYQQKKIYMGNRWEPSSQRHKNYHSAQTSTQGSSKKTSGIHGKIKLFWNNRILRECYKSTKRDESFPSSQRVQHSHHEAREIDRRNQPFTKKNDMFW